MSRKIFCTFLQREAEGLDFPIFPNALGNKIFNEISKEAWNHWLKKQTIIINEKKLSTMNIKDRRLIEQEMMNFLFKKNQNIEKNETELERA